jgi:hypothetical protein
MNPLLVNLFLTIVSTPLLHLIIRGHFTPYVPRCRRYDYLLWFVGITKENRGAKHLLKYT